MKKNYKFELVINTYRTSDINNNKFDLFIFAKFEYFNDTVLSSTDISIIKDICINLRPKVLGISGFLQEHFNYIIPYIKDNVESLSIFQCKNIFDLSCLEELKKLKFIDIDWNIKATSLWDVSKNTYLDQLIMTDCNKISDFSNLANSNISKLSLYGCNGCGSFVSKLRIENLSFISKMKNLKVLNLNIVKSLSDVEYLKIFSSLKRLNKFWVPPNFFTFEQFAFLAAKLPNTKGLDCFYLYDVSIIDDESKEYFIIGRGKPRRIKGIEKAMEYAKKYNTLIEMYKESNYFPIKTKM